ncbi:sensor domain-containing diguanylate cyclase [Paenibacillus radicis (ex Gao et al. 2016)]|uniref:sensor domain-containing diguanylate cyclase n=1 Tax=Paenibacillus radicis (ex Gao et al. 2016) TaxID=1737354 RepID=UPI001E3C75E3|nr:sensor domain-containing diguanylate cyclase [Paenibacillus radicis (ex Gao et al. 2016)]
MLYVRKGWVLLMADYNENHPLKDESAAASHLEVEMNPSIWFEEEDMTSADEPYLAPILSDSFALWHKETDKLLLAEGSFALYDWSLKCVGIAGGLNKSEEADSHALADKLAAAVQRSGSIETDSLGSLYACAVPVMKRSEERPFCVFIHLSVTGESSLTVAKLSAVHFRSCFYRRFEQLYVKDLLLQQQRTEKELNRRDALFGVAKQLYDQTDVSSVLSEMLMSLEKLYPTSEVHLYLSQDHLNGDPRVKPLVFKNTAHDLIAKAFLEGRPVNELDRNGMMRIAMPMTGKQAAYGVLFITMEAERWDVSDLPAFLLVADTAGSAFENAKLYEQSNLLINELRLINELAKRLNQSLRLKEIFQFVTKELLNIFEADFCCVLQLNKEKNQFIVMSSNVPDMSSEHFSPEYGFCGIVHRTKEPLIISDYWNTRVVTSKLMDNTGSRSLIASPILVDGEVAGVIFVTHKTANFFSYDNYKLLQVMSTHIGLAITNASLHAEVRRMVITDNLTGLHARHYLNEQIQNRQRKDPLGALILVDIDHFKRINDTFGHQVGDRILVQVSNIIRASIRQGDIAARWGGEELAVYLPGIQAEQAFRIAERIRSHVEEETDPVVTVSCGVSEWTFENEKISVESLFYRADMALYEAKHHGRNCIFVGQAN